MSTHSGVGTLSTHLGVGIHGVHILEWGEGRGLGQADGREGERVEGRE